MSVFLLISVTIALIIMTGVMAVLVDDTSQPPDVEIEFEYDAGNNSLQVIYAGGDPVNNTNTGQLRLNGTDSTEVNFLVGQTNLESSPNGGVTVSESGIESGTTIATSSQFTTLNEVRLVWTGTDGRNSTTLAEFKGPDVFERNAQFG